VRAAVELNVTLDRKTSHDDVDERRLHEWLAPLTEDIGVD
jgi:hypothetical protein